MIDVKLENTEIVARLCFHSKAGKAVFGHEFPNDVNPETSKLRYQVIKIKEMRSKGFSVQRAALFTRSDAMRHLALQRSRKPGSKIRLLGAVSATAEEIRAVMDIAGECLFEVLEKPEATDAGHSEIYLLREVKGSEILRCRVALVETLGAVVPHRQLFGRGSIFNWLGNLRYRLNLAISSIRKRFDDAPRQSSPS